MPRPPSLPALVAVAATAAFTLPVPAAAGPVWAASAPVRAAAAAPVAEDDDPLQVSIDALTPGEVPQRGPVRMRGTVTNVSDERWRAINVHAFVGDVPMTTTEELAEARLVPVEADVGERIVIPGTFDGVGGLAPGERTTFAVGLRRDQIPAEAAGVYWFGAHALGTATEGRDGVADGRARTFLPLVPESKDTVDASLVIPLRRSILHDRSGRLVREGGWARDLSPGGALRELVDLGAAAGNRPLTWLVDPALADAVQRLADGNRPRSLADTLEDDVEPGGTPSSEDSTDPSESPSADPDQPPTAASVAAPPAAEWLDRLGDALDNGRVLALPYGDLDVSAAEDHGPRLLRDARLRVGDQLDLLDVPTLPAVAPPAGYLSTEALDRLPDGTITLLSDQMLPEGEDGTVLDVDDRRVLFAASGAAEGGPGPDDPLGTIALRQRILAEAAVRLFDERRPPLLVMLPQTWDPDSPKAFFRGLGVPWFSLTDATSLLSDRPLAAEELDYPAEQRAAELPAANFETGQQLAEAGQTLANMLTANDQVDQAVLDEVLTSLSYGNRGVAEQALSRSEQSLAWVERRTRSVRVQAPPGVTLSSARGKIGTTVTNRLDHPVTISLKAITDASLSIDTPSSISLPPGDSQTVLLDARTTSPGVHYVRLVVTDDTGAPLGSSARLPVRSAQVSEVIWLILGVGVGLLFLAIAVRLVRRIRSERG